MTVEMLLGLIERIEARLCRAPYEVKSAPFLCRRKMRMSALCKVEMSAFMDGRGAHGNGANHFESTRTGPIESVARGTEAASDAGCGSRAAESNRPPGAPDAAPHPRTG